VKWLYSKIQHLCKCVVFLLYNKVVTRKSQTSYREIFAGNNGILRASTAVSLGMPRHVLYQMAKSGELVRESQGIYRLKESDPPGNPDLVQISLRVPRAVICLVSALYFHDLTTQIPHQVYFALPRDVKTPKVQHPPIRVFHFSESSYKTGVEEHILDGITVKIYGREKTIADCFKFRERIGIDIALEGLKDYLKQPRPDVSLLMKYAKVNRVEKVMRPYLEAML
jgi:hypothetical protein